MLFRLRCFGLGVIARLIAAAALSQTQNSPSPAPISAAPQPTPASQEPSKAAPTSTAPKGFVIADATPVRLRTGRTISSADAHVGDTLDFEVLEEVQVEGVLVIPKGERHSRP
jgi:hypothetical protein